MAFASPLPFHYFLATTRSLQTEFVVTLWPNFHALMAKPDQIFMHWWQQTTPSQMLIGYDLQDYGCNSCKIIWTSFLSSCFMQLVSIIQKWTTQNNGLIRLSATTHCGHRYALVLQFTRQGSLRGSNALLCIAVIWCLSKLPTLQKMTYYDNCICYQNCKSAWHGLRDDAMLALCDSHLWATWAMQPLWSTVTMEIHPQYKDPCHCENWLATLTTLWLP